MISPPSFPLEREPSLLFESRLVRQSLPQQKSQLIPFSQGVPRAGQKLGLNFPLPPGGSPTYFAAFGALINDPHTTFEMLTLSSISVNGLQTIYVPIDSSNGVTTVPAGLKGA